MVWLSPVRTREVEFIPPAAVDAAVLSRLKTGDYVGIYSPLPGLDVSHCGIVVRVPGRILLRHASSRASVARVVEEDLTAYLGGGKGLVVFRPVAWK